MLIYSIEDDQDIAKIIKLTLKKQGYEVSVFSDGKSFFNALEEQSPDLILLDMMLPDMHGLDILKMIRENTKYDGIDVIIISADHLLITKLDGFDLGADDYIEKPFDILELMSRINARFRRKKTKTILEFDDVKIDTIRRICTKNNINIDLTEKEFELLSYLAINKDDVLNRDKIFEHVWQSKNVVETRTIDMHVKSLRRKLDTKKIISVYGVGYKVID